MTSVKSAPTGPEPPETSGRRGQPGSMLRNALGTFSYRIAARAIGSLMQAVSLVLLARHVGVDTFGALSVGLSVAAILGITLGLGSTNRALRLGRESNAASTATSMFLVRLVSSAVSATAAASICFFLLSDWAATLSLALIVMADQLCELEQAVLAGQHRQFASANWVVVQRLLPLVMILIGQHFGIPTIVAYGIGSSLVLVAVLVRPLRHWTSPATIAALMRTSRGYWLAAVMGALGSLDLTVVRAFGGSTAAGLYGAANRATNPMSIFVAELLVIITPAASRAESPQARTRILRIATRTAVVLAVPLILLAPLLSGVLVAVLGPQYEHARPIITAFVIAAAISGISQTVQAKLYTEGRPFIAAGAIGAGTVLGLIALGVLGAMRGPTLLWIVPIVMQIIILILLIMGSKLARGPG